MTRSWVPYRNGSAVQEAIAMANALTEQGVTIKPMHQGYEESEPDTGTLKDLRDFQGHVAGKYNPATGHAKSRQSFAGFVENFMGLPADHCFTIQTNGRVGLGHGFDVVANLYPTDQLGHIAALLPNSRWPMVDAKAKSARISHFIDYPVERDHIAENIIAALRDDAKLSRPRIAVLYTNFPHNPTGLVSSPQEIAAIQSCLDDINTKRRDNGQPPIIHIADDPYFMGLSQNEKAPYFQSPYAGQFQLNGPTPSIHVISFSKALAMANPGFTGLVFTNTDQAKAYEKFLATDLGPSFVNGLMDNIVAIFDDKNTDALRTHFSGIEEKYRINNKIFDDSIASALDGDPGMCRVFNVPESVLGKEISLFGHVQKIETTRDVCAYIANKTGVILVAQAQDNQEKLIRIALKAKNPDLVRQSCQDIKSCLEELAAL